MKAIAPQKPRPDRLMAGLFTLVCLLASLFPSVPSAQAADPCPNEALREAQVSTAMPEGTIFLPDCMALEMVSPPRKLSLPAFKPWFSADGERVAFRSMAALGDTGGLQTFIGDSYVASRSASGWQTASTSPPPSAAITQGTGSYGGPFAFSLDLRNWLSLGATQQEAMVAAARVFKGGIDGSFAPASPPMLASDDSGDQTLQFILANIPTHGASPDLSKAVFQTSRASAYFLAGDPRNPATGDAGNEVGGDRNSYLVTSHEGKPALELLARDKDDAVHGGRCGAHLGGGKNSMLINQGAISEDGQTIYFTTRPAQPFDPEHPENAPVCSEANPLRIMERIETPQGAAISPIAPELPAGEDLFQGASADGTKAYFTTARQVSAADKDSGAQCNAVPGSSAGCDLYLYDSTKPEDESITMVSEGPAGPTPGEGADVLNSTTAISGDGSRAYFVAQGVLTDDANPEGDTATAGHAQPLPL